MKIQYWRICPDCEKSKMSKAYREWADYRAGKYVIEIRCEACQKKKPYA